MTPVFCCGFECGKDTISGGSAGHFAVFTGSPTLNYTTTKRSGASALRCNAAGSAVNAQCNFSASNELRHVGRFYIYFTSLPTGDTPLHSIGNSLTPTGPNLAFKSSDSKLYAAVGTTLGASGVTVTTATWYRIDFHYLISAAGNDTADVQVDGSAVGQATAAGAGAGDPRQIFGVHSAVTADVLYDDVLLSITAADYPIGAGKVEHFVPTSDGTHTATTTTIVKGTIAAPTGGGNVAGATDVFNWLNGVPILGGATDNTRLVNQATAGGTLYAEVIFGPAPGISTPTAAPRFVDVITADRQASTATCNFQTKLNDNGTESDIINRGTVAGVITDRYARKGYALAPTGGAWTVTAGAGNFNNLRARFGYSTDATPDVYWRGIMIEAEFAAATGYTLSPAAGSFSYTGNAATAVWSHLLTGDTGTFSSTGNAATLLKGSTLTADSGTFSYTGNTASIKRDYTLTADTGTFSYTGNAANLLRGLLLTAGTGSFSYTGNAASLIRGYGLTADTGTFSYTGNSASLVRAYSLVTDTGSYSYTGNAATLLRGLLLTAATGTFTYTGSNATLAITPVGSTTLTAGAGSFSYTGNAANLLRGYRLTADTGAFSYTGSNAVLLKGYNLTAASGSFTSTGNAANLIRGYNLQANAGTFSYTGGDAALLRAYRLLAESGVFQLVGSNATLAIVGVGGYTDPFHLTVSDGQNELSLSKGNAYITIGTGRNYLTIGEP